MDKRVIACNYHEGTNVAATGAKAYVVLMNRGNGSERVFIRLRSRGGRYVEKWEAIARLTNFRIVTLPSEHPMHSLDYADGDECNLSQLNKASFDEEAKTIKRRNQR